MVFPALMSRLERSGVGFKTLDESVEYDAPQGALTPEALAVLRTNKTAILLLELREGQEWLSREHRRWCSDDSSAATDDTFSKILDEWFAKDSQIRLLYAWAVCIHGEGRRCPEEALAACRGCAAVAAGSETVGQE
jgi:hypothetical protein